MNTMTVNDRIFYTDKLLGKGKGGYSYLVHDEEGHPFVLKQIHHEPCAYYHFENKLRSEVRDYIRLSNLDLALPQLYAVDEGQERILKEYIEGDTVMDLVAQNALRPEHLHQLMQMTQVLYAEGLNIDYYPTNFVVNGDGRMYYIDYECNPYQPEWDFEHWGRQYWIQPEHPVMH